MNTAASRLALRLLAAATVLSLAYVSPVLAQTPPAPATAAPVDPQFAAAQKAFEALPEGDRKAIQDALIWTGDFSGAGTGGFGPLTYKAILAFQARQKLKTDGILQPLDRAALEMQAVRARDAVKFARVIDGRTGARIGVPQKLLDRPRAGATGTIFASADGSAAIETYASKDELQPLYDAMRAEGPGRKVTYKVLRPDWFVVAGEGDGRRFYTRVTATPVGLRGYTLTYPAARAAEFDRIAIAVANSFEAVPAPSATPAPAPAPGPAPVAGGPVPPRPNPLPGAPQLLLTGLVVAPGKVLTAASIETCTAPMVARQPATLGKVDKATGLAVLDAPGLRAAPALAAGAVPADGAELVVVGFAASGPDVSLSVAPGEARVPAAGGLRVFAPLQRGAPGSAVFDRTGGLVGLVGAASAEPRLVAGIVPQASWPMIPGKALTEAGASLGSASAGAPRTTGDIAAAARPALVAVECGR